MGLVDYSDSESDGEPVQQKPTPAPAAASKKPFQKLLDRSSGPGKGKILVNLSAASAVPEDTPEDDQPPPKRAKIAGGSRFSSLGSFLPPPKKTGLAAPASSARATGTAPAPGVHLRTAAEPAFSRRSDADGDSSMGLDGDATHTASKGPSIPEGQKPEEEVKLVGKPLMFKPLSVARKKAPLKTKKKDPSATTAGPTPSAAAQANASTTKVAAAPAPAAPLPKKKISLFSIDDDEPATASPIAPAPTGAYEPVFTSAPEPAQAEEESDVTSAYPSYHPQPTAPIGTQHHRNQEHEQVFSSLADSLSPAARRELFGRSNDHNTRGGNGGSGGGVLPANAKVITFDMEREYAHNEALRASGAQQVYNPVRSIAPGKHSLRQVVNMAQSNQGALEESFARAKSNQKDAAGRYGW